MEEAEKLVKIILKKQDVDFLSKLANQMSVDIEILIEKIVVALRGFTEYIPQSVKPENLFEIIADYLEDGTMERVVLGTLSDCKEDFIREAVSDYIEEPQDPPDYYFER